MSTEAPVPALPERDAHFNVHPITAGDLYDIAERLRARNYPRDSAVTFRTPLAGDRREVDINVSPNPHQERYPK